MTALVLEKREERLFELGKIIVMDKVMARMAADDVFAGFVSKCLNRHAQGDWGDVPDDCRIENELSLDYGFELRSAFRSEGFPTVYIFTAGDRSETSIRVLEEA